MNEKYLEIKEANENIVTMNIKGKEYAPVHQRVKAFRIVHPNGMIVTDIVSEGSGTITMKAVIYDEDHRTLATGYAREKEGSSMINKTSCLENCESSAVGRALGLAGFGIDVSIATSEEVKGAEEKQEEIARRERDELRRKIDELEFTPETEAGLPMTSVQIFCLKNLLEAEGVPAAFVLKRYYPNTKKVEDLTQSQGVIIKRNIARISAEYQKKGGTNHE